MFITIITKVISRRQDGEHCWQSIAMLTTHYAKPPRQKALEESEWQKFFDTTKTYKNIVIGGDFNSHHTFWGDDKCCTNCRRLIESILETDL